MEYEKIKQLMKKIVPATYKKIDDTYKDNKIEEESYVFVTTEKSKKLTKYIIECSEKNDMLGLRFTLIGISIITSIVTICRLNKTETIYE